MNTNKLAKELYSIDKLKYLGQGKYSKVYKLSEEKVIKVIKPKYHRKSDFDKLEKEIEYYLLLKDVSFIPDIYEYGKDYIVIEYIKGNTLLDLLFDGFYIDKKYIEEIERKVEILERMNLYHNDTHFENIILNNNNEIILIDLGNMDRKPQRHKWKIIKKLLPIYYQYIYKYTKNPIFIKLKKPYIFFKTITNNLIKFIMFLKHRKRR